MMTILLILDLLQTIHGKKDLKILQKIVQMSMFMSMYQKQILLKLLFLTKIFIVTPKHIFHRKDMVIMRLKKLIEWPEKCLKILNPRMSKQLIFLLKNLKWRKEPMNTSEPPLQILVCLICHRFILTNTMINFSKKLLQ